MKKTAKKRARRRTLKTVRVPEVVVETKRVRPARTRIVKQPATLAEAIGEPVVGTDEKPAVVRTTVRKTVRRRAA